MQINVTVDGLDGVDLHTVIGEQVTQYDEDGVAIQGDQLTLGDLVAQKLADKIYSGLDYEHRHQLAKTAAAERVKLIRERLEPQVEEALNGAIRKTNNYGEPTGQTTTMRELVIAEITQVIGAKGDRYSSNQKSLLDTVVNGQVAAALQGELKKAFDAEREKVVAAVRAQAAELVAQAVKQGLGQR